jgi:hypothetical protein
MKVQFCYNLVDPVFGNDVIADFDVAEEPTEEQCKAVQEYIDSKVDEWHEENDGDFSEFDYYEVCFEAASRNLKLVDNVVVKTFYL